MLRWIYAASATAAHWYFLAGLSYYQSLSFLTFLIGLEQSLI